MGAKLFTQSDKVTMEQAMQALDKKLNSTQNTILGGNISFIPMITDPGGELSGDRIDALAGDMVKALREYITPYGKPEPIEIPVNYHFEQNYIVPDECAPALEADEDALYKSFAYCAICVAANTLVFNGAFGDILDIAANRAYTADSEYYWSTGDSLEMFGNLVCCALGTDVLSEYYTKSNQPVYQSAENNEASCRDAGTWKQTIPDPERFISEFRKYVRLNNEKPGGKNHIAERSNIIMTTLKSNPRYRDIVSGT